MPPACHSDGPGTVMVYRGRVHNYLLEPLGDVRTVVVRTLTGGHRRAAVGERG